MPDQSEKTNFTGMEHILLLVITVGSKELAIGRARLDNILIHYNQSRASIDRRGNGDWYISLGIINSCTEMNRIQSG